MMPIGLDRAVKRCPFCGNPDVEMILIKPEDGFRVKFAVRCNYDSGGCGAEGGWRHNVDEAVDVWNQRKRKWTGDGKESIGGA